jgi:hypothetical protein
MFILCLVDLRNLKDDKSAAKLDLIQSFMLLMV